MKETLKRTRWIWALVYTFLTGMNVGLGHWTGMVMFALGGTILFWWTSHIMNPMCKTVATKATSAGTVTVKLEVDTAQATKAIEELRNRAMCAKRDIDVAFRAGEL
jgi:uncharacterized membrane protein YhiD involved in acid resistance